MANEKRLIDVNAEIRKMRDALAKNKRNTRHLVYWVFDTVISVLEKAPTVDAVEVIHAHWEDGCAIHNGKEVYKSIDCSHCNEIFKIESHDREYWKKRFKVCPFCGAKMDGGDEE